MKRDPWYYGTWEGARVARHEQNLKLTLPEKILLLESMEEMAVTMQTQRRRQNLPVDPKIASLIDSRVAEDPAPYQSSSEKLKK